VARGAYLENVVIPDKNVQLLGGFAGGPAAAYIKQTTGSWTAVFLIVAALDIITAVLAITALRSMRAKHIKGT